MHLGMGNLVAHVRLQRLFTVVEQYPTCVSYMVALERGVIVNHVL